MSSKKLLFLAVLSIFIFFFLKFSLAQEGGVTQPPQPPSENPHPPITPQDKARVAFADFVIKKLLMTPRTKLIPLKQRVYPYSMDNKKFNLSKECIKSLACLSKNELLQNSIDSLKSEYGVVHQFMHIHIIPWSFEKFQENQKNAKPPTFDPPSIENVEKIAGQQYTKETLPPILGSDEYMLHSYVNFKEVPRAYRPDWVSNWYHLDIIVTEDKEGNILLRRFFLIGLSRPNIKMPD